MRISWKHGLLAVSALLLVTTVSQAAVPMPKAEAFDWYGHNGSGTFREEFNGTELDSTKWLIAAKQWGGDNNGVVPENVKLSGGKLILEAHGDSYTGDVLGLKRDGSAPGGVKQGGKQRVGAAIASRDYLGSGKYTMRAKVIGNMGVASTMWTFNYQEYYPGDPEFQRAVNAGLVSPTAEYYAYNHEIDIELPGRPGAAHTGQSFQKALFNTFTGENEGEYQTTYGNLPVNVADGQFHDFSFEWHTGSPTEAARVDYYIDNVKVATNTNFIPTNAGRLWLGVWFPNTWAGGPPSFDVKQMEVDWFEFTPYNEPGDTWMPETFPDDGWESMDFRPMTGAEINQRNPSAGGVWRDDFNGTTLNPGDWLVAKKNWGGQLGNGLTGQSFNGGVHPDNVKLDGQGNLALEAHGNYYNGLPLGINRTGAPRKDGKRVGAAIATSRYFGSGEYEVRMKVPNVNNGSPHGAVPAIWTFHYQEFDEGSPEYVANNGTGDYWASNHEIDIELPGRPGPPHTGMTFEKALFNTWQGERESPQEYHANFTDLGENVAITDGGWHTFKFIWETGDTARGVVPSVKFYLDGDLKWTATGANYVPNKPGRLWLGYWFPRNWAGAANFSTSQLLIDYVSIKPYSTGGAVVQSESYPMDGFAAWEEYPGYCSSPCGGGAPTPTPSATPGVTPTPTPGATPTPGVTPTPTPSVTPTPTPGATSTPTPSPTPSVTPTPGPNLLVNGDFSGGMNGWTQSGGSASVTGGEMVLASNSVTSRAEQQNITVTSGRKYRLSGNLKNSNAASWTYLGLTGSMSNVTNSQGNTNKEAGISGTAYTQAWIEFTATSNTVSVYTSFYKDQAGSGYADQLTLVEIP
ncbi:family 16 glycosylhydrolase [Paenibacillus herberti]|uniref:GH16 domain-containing protein n=1 Tax=Paenibacillus herberti TaxID=1619309 RepID=A0A229NXL6_9BACL|nr:family 16 glycosylhydrolase [Paenibacillus herberti]OXM14663.1 hypothetical protein CGZ75_17275 [Paenibacillus herberti]